MLEKNDLILIFALIGLTITCSYLTFLVTRDYEHLSYNKLLYKYQNLTSSPKQIAQTLGFYAQDTYYSQLSQIQDLYDYKGDWVCVNVAELDINQSLAICQHEISHEIFAEKCENRSLECLEKVK